MLACLTPVFWTKLVIALDLVEWLADPRFAGAPVAIPVIEDRERSPDAWRRCSRRGRGTTGWTFFRKTTFRRSCPLS
jgi:hypothetical protein